MLRSKLFKAVLEAESSLQNQRFFASEASKTTNFKEEWNNAKPYESIPSMTRFQGLRNFIPGGELKIHANDKRS
jgi:hypothetical protein